MGKTQNSKITDFYSFRQIVKRGTNCSDGNCSDDKCSADNCSADNCSGDNCSADNCSEDNCSGDNCSEDNCSEDNCSADNCFDNCSPSFHTHTYTKTHTRANTNSEMPSLWRVTLSLYLFIGKVKSETASIQGGTERMQQLWDLISQSLLKLVDLNLQPSLNFLKFWHEWRFNLLLFLHIWILEVVGCKTIF